MLVNVIEFLESDLKRLNVKILRSEHFSAGVLSSIMKAPAYKKASSYMVMCFCIAQVHENLSSNRFRLLL